jgi:hypothetical protein
MMFGSRLFTDLHNMLLNTLAPQTARMSVHSIHPITRPTTLTLEVQASQAKALEGNQGFWTLSWGA